MRARPLDYTNPKLPEGINTSPQHPLKEFAILSGGVLLLVAAVLAVLSLMADYLAQYIPFAYEDNISRALAGALPSPNETADDLQILADRLSARMELPPGMKIRLHYSDQDAVNAFATLGGHVVMFRGLLEKLPNENALAMVLAHEIAHVKHRHPVRSLGRGAVVALAVGALLGISGESLTESLLGNTALVSLLKFSRDQEEEADRSGFAAVVGVYGHGAGALELYNVLAEHSSTQLAPVPEFFQTHPGLGDRISTLEKFAQARGWARAGETTPLEGTFARPKL